MLSFRCSLMSCYAKEETGTLRQIPWDETPPGLPQVSGARSELHLISVIADSRSLTHVVFIGGGSLFLRRCRAVTFVVLCGSLFLPCATARSEWVCALPSALSSAAASFCPSCDFSATVCWPRSGGLGVAATLLLLFSLRCFQTVLPVPVSSRCPQRRC